MKLKPKITITDHFSAIEDPRIDRSKHHKLIDIITIAICAVICGAERWTDIETYGRVKYEWLKHFLELPLGNSESRYVFPCVRTVKSSTVPGVFSQLD